jgi:hypothetical protein
MVAEKWRIGFYFEGTVDYLIEAFDYMDWGKPWKDSRCPGRDSNREPI